MFEDKTKTPERRHRLGGSFPEFSSFVPQIYFQEQSRLSRTDDVVIVRSRDFAVSKMF